MEIPLWAYRSIFAKAGARLPKKPEPVVQKFGYHNRRGFQSSSGYSPAPYFGPGGPGAVCVHDPLNGGFGTALSGVGSPTVPITQPFIISDYIQFYNCTSNALGRQWSLCRVCITVCWGAQERIRHMDFHPECRKFLFLAIKKLKEDRKCVICNAPTGIVRYAVYLCGDGCENTWKHNERQGRENFREALRLSGWNDESHIVWADTIGSNGPQ